ncbi:MAG: riboflavin synthase, partial [Thermodesulfobacteriota bacterium]
GVGTILKKGLMGSYIEIELKVPDELRAGLVFKGSITVDGISLTIASVTRDGVRVALVPHTIANTTLEDKAVDSSVNIETDIIGKYVESKLHGKKIEGRVTESFLAEHGFTTKKE